MNVIKIFMMCVLVFNAFIPFSYAANEGPSSSGRGLEDGNPIKKTNVLISHLIKLLMNY